MYSWIHAADEFELAGAELARGVELSPDGAEGRRYYGSWLKIAGRAEEALGQMRAAARLAPTAPFMRVGEADVLMTLGRYDEAVGALREALRLQPRYEAALERLEMACHRAGRHEEALDARRALLGARGATARMTALEQRTAELGWVAAREADLRAELATLLERAETEDPFLDRDTSRQLSDQIIIDTGGFNPFNNDEMKDLAKLIVAGDIEPVLVLPAGLDAAESGEMGRVFAALGVHRLLATRVDIARRLGGLLSAAHQGNLAFADVSATPQVADGLQALSPRRLGSLFFPATQTPRGKSRSTSRRKSG